jgi:hypothetical protein
MSLRVHGTIIEGRVTKECPVCGERMDRRVDGADAVWTCRNDNCAHQEEV